MVMEIERVTISIIANNKKIITCRADNTLFGFQIFVNNTCLSCSVRLTYVDTMLYR